MRSNFIQYSAFLLVVILDLASGSLLRRDNSIRSPRSLEENNESLKLEKKDNELRPKSSDKSKRKKEHVQGDDLSTSSEAPEKEVEQIIVHSNHPKAATVQEGASEKEVKQIVHSHHSEAANFEEEKVGKKEEKQIVQSHHPKGATGKNDDENENETEKPKSQRKHSKKQHEAIPVHEHKEQKSINVDSERTDTKQQVMSRASGIQNQSLYAEQEDDLSTLVGRPVEVLAIEYSTRSDKRSTEVETLYMVHLTEHLLSSMYFRTFENDDTVHFEGINVQHYISISPRLVQFEITTLFQQTNGLVVPSSAQVVDVIIQGLAESGDFYSEYLATLEQMPFEVFSTTSSFRVITDAAELQRLIERCSDEDEKPKTILIVAVIFVGLSIFICAFAWFRGSKGAKEKSVESHDIGGISQATSGFKTATFDDPIAGDAYLIEEADVESFYEKDLEEVALNDDVSNCKSVEESEWTSDTESFTMIFKDDMSDASQESRRPEKSPGLGLPVIALSSSSSLSSEATDLDGNRPFEMKNRVRPFPKPQSREGEIPSVSSVGTESVFQARTFADRNLGRTEAKPDTTDKIVPLWMKKRQEVMQQRERSAMVIEAEKFSVHSVASRSKTSISDLPVQDLVNFTPRESNQAGQMSAGKIEAKPNTSNKHVPLWMRKRQEIMQQREQSANCTDTTVEPLPPLGDQRLSVELSASDVLIEETAPVCPGKSELGPNEPRSAASMSLPASDVSIVNVATDTICRLQSEVVADEPIAVSPVIFLGSDVSVVRGTTDAVNHAHDELTLDLQTHVASQLTSEDQPMIPISDASFINETKDPFSHVHGELIPDQPIPAPVDYIAVTADQNQSKTRNESDTGEDLPLWMIKRQEIMQQSEQQSNQDAAEPSSSSGKEETRGPVTFEHSEFSSNEQRFSRSDNTNTMADRNPPGTEGNSITKHSPLWMRKRQKAMQQSSLQPPQNETEISVTAPASSLSPSNEETSGPAPVGPIEPTTTQLESTNVTTDQNGSKIEDAPLWMRKRQEIAQLSEEEESVCENELDSLTNAPMWMTRFKRIDKN